MTTQDSIRPYKQLAEGEVYGAACNSSTRRALARPVARVAFLCAAVGAAAFLDFGRSVSACAVEPAAVL